MIVVGGHLSGWRRYHLVVRRVAAAATLLFAATACAGGSGSKSRRPSGTVTCGEALDRIEQLTGNDLDYGSMAGPISGFEGLNSRRRWREACAHFSPWVKRCIVLSNVRQEVSSCAPGNEPWSRRHEFGHVPPEEKREFESCVSAANSRRELMGCGYEE